MTHTDPFGGNASVPAPISMIEVNGAYLQVNLPPASKSVVSGSGEEYAQGLPPYARTSVYRTRDIPNAPLEWGKSDYEFAVPVANGSGMWLDFNYNTRNSHHVAIMISMQGINALTRENMLTPEGLQMKKLPEQNYLATTGTPSPLLWLDGFKSEDGITRQFYFTDDATKGVAAHVLKGQQTHSFGVLFFRSRQPKPPQPVYRGSAYLGGDEEMVLSAASSEGPKRSYRSASTLEVGAGAKINQRIYADPNDLSFWEPQPFAKIVLYFAPAASIRPLDSLQASGIPVGKS
jgi:hypothetical protein